MHIVITKKKKDPRPSRDKVLDKGMKLVCDKATAKLFFDADMAKEYEEGIKAKPVIKTVEEAEKINE